MLVAAQQLPKWKSGYLDLHHISTGRGTVAYVVLPNGQAMLIDMGENESESDNGRRATPKPNSSKSAAEWTFDYIKAFAPEKQKLKLDFAVLSHFDNDHIGTIERSTRFHQQGQYPLSGITELGSLMPIGKLVDRGYDFPIDISNIENTKKFRLDTGLVNRVIGLKKFVDYQVAENGMKYEKVEVGSANQFKINNPKQYANFQIIPLFANGQLKNSWNDSIGFERYKRADYPGENPLSIGLRISYGKFDYYTGGDINGINHLGQSDFNSMEAHAGPVIGPVDVATLNHHGNRDSHNEYFVRNIRPSVWIGQSWSSSHPGEDVIRRLTFTDVYPGERDLFTTYRAEANELVIGRRNKKSPYKGKPGHIVVRVYPDGEHYDVFVLNDENTNREILSKISYTSR
jgi:beta-lactamase superfamily II metal-dependent hydrolase